MRRAAVRQGDSTTTRGSVLAYSSTMYDDGKRIALDGDEATCGECEGTFKIEGTGIGWKENGRSLAMDGDRVLCPCGKNYLRIGSNPGYWLSEGTSASEQNKTMPVSSPASRDTGHWIRFVLNDRESCEGMSCIAYFDDGSDEHGVIDSTNSVHFGRSNDSQCTRIDFVTNELDQNKSSVRQALLSEISL